MQRLGAGDILAASKYNKTLALSGRKSDVYLRNCKALLQSYILHDVFHQASSTFLTACHIMCTCVRHMIALPI